MSTNIKDVIKNAKTDQITHGIDVSKYQKGWDWKNLALFADAEGQVFAGAPENHDFPQPSLFIIMKATEGADLQDSSYTLNSHLIYMPPWHDT